MTIRITSDHVREAVVSNASLFLCQEGGKWADEEGHYKFDFEGMADDLNARIEALAEAAAPHLAARKSLEDAHYVLFGHDDHFNHLLGDLTADEAERFSDHIRQAITVMDAHISNRKKP